MAGESGFKKGLEGVLAATTRLSHLDGANGRLAYGGYDIEDLAGGASFEEVVYLLWHGDLPTRSELETLARQLSADREVPSPLLEALRRLPPPTPPMRALQAAVAMLGAFDPDAETDTPEALLRKVRRLVAQIPTVIAAHHRIRSGLEPVPPSKGLSHAANFLYSLTGKTPSDVNAKAFEASLVLYAEHELNASTFTIRVVASTLSDVHSAVAAAVGALKGPLHGGAGEAVMLTLQEIGRIEEVEAFTRKALAARRRLMGFGHRVYRAGDPRARILRVLAEEACRQSGQGVWFEMACRLHEAVNREKGLHPNVDFYSAPLFYALGIPVDLFVPVIAVARIAGWTAHLLEQYRDNRLIRPRAEYLGPGRRPFTPLTQR